MTNKTRLQKITTALTPTQAVIAWMQQVHQHDSWLAAVASLLGQPDAAYPLFLLPDQVQRAVRTAMRGHPREAVARAERQAVQDVAFLFHVQQRLNLRVLEEQERLVLQWCWLAEGMHGLIEQDQREARQVSARLELEQSLPYPLDRGTAAAVQAAFAHHVETDDALSDAETISSWVTDSFVAEGRTLLPGTAYYGRDGEQGRRSSVEPASEDELRALFPAEADYADFIAGRDFSYGLADVRDAEVAARSAAVEAALHELRAAGAVQSGLVLRLPTVPNLLLQEAPMIDGEWLDRFVVELAEQGALATKRGSTSELPADDHPLATQVALAATGERADAQLRLLTEKHLATFPGRRRSIDGREYLHAVDYEGWRGRWLKGRMLATAQQGIVAASWNGWVDQHGDAGTAQLAGVSVGEVRCWAEGSPYTVCEPDELEERLQRRASVFAALTIPGMTGQSGGAQDAAAPSGAARGLAERARAWRQRATTLLAASSLLQELSATLSRQYFQGQPLYPAAACFVEELLRDVELVVGYFNDWFAAPLDHDDRLRRDVAPAEQGAAGAAVPLLLDVARVREGGRRAVAAAVAGVVGLARVAALEDIGERRRAQDLLQQQFSSAAGAVRQASGGSAE